MKELRVLAPTAILGYGFPIQSFEEGLRRDPHLIAVDAGSSDPGPFYLGAGVSFTDRSAVKRDLELLLTAARERKIPLIIGSAGGSGGEPHLEWNVDIIEEIAKEKKLSFKMAVIHGEISPELVQDKLADGKVKPLPPLEELTCEELEKTERIVGQMGIEPFIRALEMGAEVIVAGRAYDPAVFAAPAVLQGFDRGLALHMGKILECACIASTPGSGSDCMMGFLREDCFLVEPLNSARRCTPMSVAAHTLYEKSNPYLLPSPGGALDLSETQYLAASSRAVKITGSKFIPDPNYTIKLEGVKKIGYRTISIAGVRDPVMIQQIDEIIDSVREKVAENFAVQNLTYFLDFKVYGKNGVMAGLEPVVETNSHELGIIIEAVAPCQATADTICSFARSTMLHWGYEGRLSTAGNLAFPYSPSDFQAGPVYVFNVYHLLEVSDPCELFPMELCQVGEVGA
ncbi:MAG TPA: acyclic terpene utilization AtuA family protein [Bacillota bacterium]|nr:acyclic terpene utilization AtuA family protein [Bacillota bacterium]